RGGIVEQVNRRQRRDVGAGLEAGDFAERILHGHVGGFGEPGVDDFGAGFDQRTGVGLGADDVGVGAGIGGGGRVARQGDEIPGAADVVGGAIGFHVFAQRHGVNGLAGAVQLGDGREDDPVMAVVKVV